MERTLKIVDTMSKLFFSDVMLYKELSWFLQVATALSFAGAKYNLHVSDGHEASLMVRLSDDPKLSSFYTVTFKWSIDSRNELLVTAGNTSRIVRTALEMDKFMDRLMGRA